MRAPAQVDVVAHQGQPAVEAAEPLEDVTPDQHAGGGHRQDGPDVVVLAPGPVRGGPGRSSGGRSWRWRRRPQAVAGGRTSRRSLGPTTATSSRPSSYSLSTTRSSWARASGSGGAVVVQQPQPLHRLSVGKLRQVVGVVAPGARDGVPAAGPPQIRQVVRGEDRGGAGGLLDGLAEAGAPGEVEHAVVAEGVGDQPGGVVGAAGVGGHGVLDGALLAEQPGERVGQPAGSVVGDEDRRHHVTRELRCGSEVLLGCRVAVHGHRGAGPGSEDCGGRPCLLGVAGRLGRAPTLSAGQGDGPPPVDNPPARGRSCRYVRGVVRLVR